MGSQTSRATPSPRWKIPDRLLHLESIVDIMERNGVDHCKTMKIGEYISQITYDINIQTSPTPADKLTLDRLGTICREYPQWLDSCIEDIVDIGGALKLEILLMSALTRNTDLLTWFMAYSPDPDYSRDPHPNIPLIAALVNFEESRGLDFQMCCIACKRDFVLNDV